MMHEMQADARVRHGVAEKGSRRGAQVAARAAKGRGRRSILARAVDLIEADRPREADLLLTAELLCDPRDSDLWLVAGLARIRRGCAASAEAALRMCSWLSGDPLAGELLRALEG
jgi:hypothetical protein